MARDYARIVRALRAKADDPIVPEAEKRALRERASQIEAKYKLNLTQPSTVYETTITDRSGATGTTTWVDWARYWESWLIAERLVNQQKAWNKPPVVDEEIVEDRYADAPEDEDVGYEIYEEEYEEEYEDEW